MVVKKLQAFENKFGQTLHKISFSNKGQIFVAYISAKLCSKQFSFVLFCFMGAIGDRNVYVMSDFDQRVMHGSIVCQLFNLCAICMRHILAFCSTWDMLSKENAYHCPLI